MSYPKKIVKVRPLGGIVSDLPPFEVAPEFYTQGNNVHFRSSFAERTKGHAQVYVNPNTGVKGDGTNYLDGGDIAAFDFGATQDFTIEVSVKRSGGTATIKRIIGKRDGGGAGWSIDVDEAQGNARFLIEDTSTNSKLVILPVEVPDDGNFYHLAMSIDRTADEMSLYIDGAPSIANPFDISAITGAIDAGIEPFRTHANNTAGAVFAGIVEEVRVWDDVRTMTEIVDNIDREISGSSANLIGYWRMNGLAGASVTTVSDETSGANTLTDTGAGDLTYADSQNAFKTGSLTTLRNISNCQVEGNNYWVYHGTDKSSVVLGGVHDDITKAGGITGSVVANVITSGLLNGVHFMNNGIDAPMFWDGIPANPMTDLTGWPASTTCKAMRAFKFHLFAMDISKPAGEFPMQVLWSDAAAPGTIPSSWTPAATNESGDVELSQTPGQVIDGLALRSSFMLYKQHSAYIADYVRGNNIFNFRRAFITAGVLTRNCIAEYRGRHFVVTDGDIILTDGSTMESIADNRMRKFLFNQLDQTNFEATFVASFPKQNEIWVCFPSAGSTFCDLALIWDGVANAWGVRELPDIAHAAVGIVSDVAVSEFWDDDDEVWDDDTTTWNQQNFSNADDRFVLAQPDDNFPTSSKFFEVDSGRTFDGANIAACISKYSMSFDDPNRVKFLRRLVPHIEADAGTELKIRAGSQMVSSDPIAWSNEVTYKVGTDFQVDTFAQGKFLSFEFRSDAIEPWLITGFDVEAELRGYY